MTDWELLYARCQRARGGEIVLIGPAEHSRVCASLRERGTPTMLRPVEESETMHRHGQYLGMVAGARVVLVDVSNTYFV